MSGTWGGKMLTGTSVSITIVGSSFTAFSSLSTNPCFSIPMVSNSYNRGFLKIQHIINVMVYLSRHGSNV